MPLPQRAKCQDYDGLGNYKLTSKPEDSEKVSSYLVRRFEDDYGKLGRETWIRIYGGPTTPDLEIGGTTLDSVFRSNYGCSGNLNSAGYQLEPGDWIMTVDPGSG